MAFTQEPGCDSASQVCWHFTGIAECITVRGALKDICHPALGFNVLWSKFNKGQLKIHCCAAENIKFWAPYIFQGAQFHSTRTPEYISVKLHMERWDQEQLLYMKITSTVVLISRVLFVEQASFLKTLSFTLPLTSDNDHTIE